MNACTTRPITEPGIYTDYPVDDYFADPCPTPSLNQTLAKLLLERAAIHAKYAHPRLAPVVADDDDDDAPEKYDKSKAIGNAAHGIILGRGKGMAIGEFDNWKKKEAQNFKAAAIADGDEPILRKHYQQAAKLALAVKIQLEDHQCSDCFQGEGKREAVLVWQEDGIWFRTMIDFLSEDLRRCDDLKTTAQSCSPEAVPYLMDDAGWCIQAAMWERGLNVLDPANAGRRRYRFVAVENALPFALTVNEIQESELTLGRRKLQAAIDIWKRCITSGVWEGYPTTTQFPATPGYRLSQWEARELELREARS